MKENTQVEFPEANLSRKLLLQLFDEWPDRAAGAAPGSPEVNEDDALELLHPFTKGGISKGFDRWVQQYALEIEKRCRSHLNTTTNSWRVDETYVKAKGVSRQFEPGSVSCGNV